MSNLGTIGEYLASIGFKVDEASFKKGKSKLEEMAKKFAALFDAKKLEPFIKGIKKLMVAVLAFEVAATAAILKFTESVTKADMQVQIFARRMMITIANARSLKAAMGAMGLHNLEDLKDIALNPELRKQFLELRALSDGLEPGAYFKQGVDNFRQVGYELQRIHVLMTYFFQYVVGALGKLLQGPLGKITKVLEYWTKTFKTHIAEWAEKIAVIFEYILKFAEVLGRIVLDVGKLMIDIGRASGITLWLKLAADLLLLILREVDKLIQKLDQLWNHIPPGLRKILGLGAVGAAGGGILGAMAGRPIGAIAGGVIGGAVGTAIGPEGTVWGGVLGSSAGSAIGSVVGPWAVGTAGALMGAGTGAAVAGGMELRAKIGGGLKAYADKMAAKYGLNKQVFETLINYESGWRKGIVSKAGAIGLGQLMPATARGLGVNPYDPYQNLEGSARLLHNNLVHFHGNYT